MAEVEVKVGDWKSDAREILRFLRSSIYEDLKREIGMWIERGQMELEEASDLPNIFRNQGRISCMKEFLLMLDYIKSDIKESLEIE